jgi:protoporphyrinogen oxidase
VEHSHGPTVATPPAVLLRRVQEGLQRAGILRPDDEIVVSDVQDIRYAYVLFDQHRARVVPTILSELERRGIHSIGRYGRWEHSSMEDAIGQGKQLAKRLRSIRQRGEG